jgi:hypothetical protein
LVGAPHGSNGPNRAGLAYLFSGADASLLLAFASPNEQVTGFFGWSVAAAGDISSDGIADMIVGAWGEYSGSGRAYVLSGSDGSVLFQLTSPNSEPSGRFGYSVAAPGDVSQDGIPDVIVGAELEGPNNNGRAHAFSGQDGSVLSTLVSPNDGTGDGFFGKSIAGARDINRDGVPDLIVGAPVENPGNSPPNAGRAYVFLSPAAFRMNSGGPNYTDANGDFFVGDRAYELGGVGYVGGHQRHFSQPIGGTDDDPLYQDVRMARGQDSDGSFAYRFDVASSGLYGVTLFLMAPALEGAGSVVMDVQAEQDVAIDDLDVTAEAGGEYQALVKTFAVDVEDGTLDLRFRAVNKAAVVSAIAVEAQAPAGADLGLRRSAAR